MPPPRRKASPSTAAARDTAAAERQEKLTALQGQLADSVAALRSGDDWKRALEFATRFPSYSFNNYLLIARQRPDATLVAGYQAWRALGRQVGKGEKGIAILAPLTRRIDTTRGTTEGSSKDYTPQNSQQPHSVATSESSAASPMGSTHQVFGFRATHVFDISQTTGDPVPEFPRPTLLDGQAPPRLWDALSAVVTRQGYTLQRGDCDGANGWMNFTTRTIRIRDDVSDAQATKTLAHEIGHMLLHDRKAFTEGVTRQCRGVQEVEAESVAYLISAHAGLDTSAYTFAYVAGWAEDVPGTRPEDVIRATGKRVIDTSSQVIGDVDTYLASPEQFATHAALTERVTHSVRDTATLAAQATDSTDATHASPVSATTSFQSARVQPQTRPETDPGIRAALAQATTRTAAGISAAPAITTPMPTSIPSAERG